MRALLIAGAVGLATSLGACTLQSPPSTLGSGWGEGPGSGNGSGDGPGTGSGSGNGSGTGSGSGPGATGAAGATGGPATQGHAIFDAEVKPILEAACAECHSGADNLGPDILGATTDAYYPTLESWGYVTVPASSMLLLKGAHTGPAFTAEQKSAVVAWLAVEAEERGLTGAGAGGGSAGTGGDPPVIVTVEEAIQQWGDCMSLADWELVNMDGVANQNTTAGPCKSCHVTGTGGAFLSDDSNETFQMSREMPYILKLVLPKQDQNGSVTGWVHADRLVNKGGEQGSHPKYIMTFERQLAIESFVNETIDRWSQGPCGP